MSSRYALPDWNSLSCHYLTLQSDSFSSSLHQRDARADLFKNFAPSPSSSPGPSSLSTSHSPRPAGYSYGYGGYSGRASPAIGTSANPTGHGHDPAAGSFRSATPNSRGQYSQAALQELESQNDDHVAGILGKVRILKDVSILFVLSLLC